MGAPKMGVRGDRRGERSSDVGVDPLRRRKSALAAGAGATIGGDSGAVSSSSSSSPCWFVHVRAGFESERALGVRDGREALW